MITCQLSLFPIPKGFARQGIIDEVVARLKYHEVEYEATKFSITLYGRENDVWTAVQDLYYSLRQVCGHSFFQAVFLEGDYQFQKESIASKVAFR
ncbi:MAG: hypothetical protein GX750_04390 [Clostridia bacterium]|nr:hypothetical protein [Clostridia bacterium]